MDSSKIKGEPAVSPPLSKKVRKPKVTITPPNPISQAAKQARLEEELNNPPEPVVVHKHHHHHTPTVVQGCPSVTEVHHYNRAVESKKSGGCCGCFTGPLIVGVVAYVGYLFIRSMS